METIRQSVFLLALQIVATAAICGSFANVWIRRRGTRAQRASWYRAARALLRLTPAAVALVLGGAAWVLVAELPLPHFGLIFWVGATMPITAGQRFMVRAGALQSRARIIPCRRLARLAGKTTLTGVLAGLAALFTVPVVNPQGWFFPGAITLLLAIAVLGLLGGLSGKPRPVGGIGTLLWLIAWGLVIHETLPRALLN